MNITQSSTDVADGSVQPPVFELIELQDTPLHLTQLPVDVRKLLELTGGDRTLGRDFLECFLEYAPTYLDSLKQALTCLDFSQIAYQAHQLKGAAGMIASRPVLALAQQIEAEAKNGQSQNLMLLLTQLEEQLIEVEHFLQTW